MSVARSPLKDAEDYFVGQAVVFSADALLRETGQILTGMRGVVMGYGKIGSSIAANLRAKSVRVDVFDSKPVKQAFALAHGYHTSSRENLIAQADLIFCATGNKSLVVSDFAMMKKDAYVFTASSGDDEIADCKRVLAKAAPSSSPKISVFEIDGKVVYICNEGNSANFMHGGAVSTGER